jgi:hypothetical protein
MNGYGAVGRMKIGRGNGISRKKPPLPTILATKDPI